MVGRACFSGEIHSENEHEHRAEASAGKSPSKDLNSGGRFLHEMEEVRISTNCSFCIAEKFENFTQKNRTMTMYVAFQVL